MTSAAGRQNSSGGGRVSTMSKELGEIKDLADKYLMLFKENPKSVALHDEMLLQLSKNVDCYLQQLEVVNQQIAERAAGRKNSNVLPFTPVPSTCSSSMGDSTMSNESDEIKDLAVKFLMLLEENSKYVALKNEKILQLSKNVDCYLQQLEVVNQQIAERAAGRKNSNVLPFTPVPSTCSSSMGDVSSAELQDQQEQQDIIPKKRMIRQAATKQPDPGPLEVVPCLKVNATREEDLDVLPFPPVSSTCSSGKRDLSSAELQDQQEQQDIIPKKRRIRQAATKQPDPDPLESNQRKLPRSRITRAKKDKMEELSLITADYAYYTCLGNYDPIKDEPVSDNANSNLVKRTKYKNNLGPENEEKCKESKKITAVKEIPSFKVITYSCSYDEEGTEDMSDDVFERRHYKLEQCEKKLIKRDLQRIRELERVEYLKGGRNKQKSNDNNKEELTTLLSSPSNIKSIEITDKVPVSAFGSNLYFKKKLGICTFYRSQWGNDGSQVPK